MQSASIFARYWIVLPIITFVITGLLSWGMLSQGNAAAEHAIVDAAKEKIASSIRVHTSALTAADFSSEDRAYQKQLFSDLFAKFQAVDTVRSKVWNKDYVVVWSDLDETIGQRFPENEEVSEAYDGEVVMELNEQKAEHVTERQFETLAETYVPIMDSTGTVIGVFEVYSSTTDIQNHINDATRKHLPISGTIALVAAALAWAARRFFV